MTLRFGTILLMLALAGPGCTASRVVREQLAEVTTRNAALQQENRKLQLELAVRK